MNESELVRSLRSREKIAVLEVGHGPSGLPPGFARRSGVRGMVGTPAEKPAAGRKARALQMRSSKFGLLVTEPRRLTVAVRKTAIASHSPARQGGNCGQVGHGD
jgi:hypothetical protein